MKVSTRGRYGMRLMVTLALNYEKGTMSLKTIAKQQHISEKYLEQIISLLAKANLVKSYRGAQGGYVLARDPKEIFAVDILTVLEGSLAPVSCVDDCACEHAGHCATLPLWTRINNAVSAVVSETSLDDLASDYLKKHSMML